MSNKSMELTDMAYSSPEGSNLIKLGSLKRIHKK